MKKQNPISALMKKTENGTVVFILICFFVAIIVLQLISGAVAGSVEYPTFITPMNLLNILSQNTCAGIMAIGMMLVIITGGIDLSVGMLSSFTAIFCAKCIADWGVATPVAIILAIVLAVGLEMGMGFIISRTKVEPFIITLGGMITFQGVALVMCHSQEVRLSGELEALKTNLINVESNGVALQLPAYVFIFIAVVIIFWLILKYTKYGRRLYAVGSNKDAAFLAGIDVKNMTLSAYAFNGLLVGIASLILLARVNVANITIGDGYEIDAIAAAVIGGAAMSGGKGNAWGTFFGAILLGSIGNAMTMLHLNSEWQYVAKGAIIIAAVTAGAVSATLASKKSASRKENEAVNKAA